MTGTGTNQTPTAQERAGARGVGRRDWPRLVRVADEGRAIHKMLGRDAGSETGGWGGSCRAASGWPSCETRPGGGRLGIVDNGVSHGRPADWPGSAPAPGGTRGSVRGRVHRVGARLGSSDPSGRSGRTRAGGASGGQTPRPGGGAGDPVGAVGITIRSDHACAQQRAGAGAAPSRLPGPRTPENRFVARRTGAGRQHEGEHRS